MSQGNLLTAIRAFIVAWLAYALFVPSAISAAILAGVLIVLIVTLRVINRANWQWVGGGLVAGALVSILVPSLRVDAIAGYALIWSAVAGIVLAFQV